MSRARVIKYAVPRIPFKYRSNFGIGTIFENKTDKPADLLLYALNIALDLFPYLLSDTKVDRFEFWLPISVVDALGISPEEGVPKTIVGEHQLIASREVGS